jgi:hypothetical protein
MYDRLTLSMELTFLREDDIGVNKSMNQVTPDSIKCPKATKQ